MEAFVAVGIAIVRLGLGLFLPQPSPDTLPHLPLHFVEHTRAIGVVEVADPSPHPNIDAGDDFFGFLPVGAPGCLFPDRLPQLAAAFRAGFAMRIAFATSRFPPCQPEPQKLKALFLEVHDTGLRLIEFEFPLSQPAFQPTIHSFLALYDKG